MLALSIRQPYAELIPSTYSGQALRGIKTIEYRSRATKIVGERFWIYAGKRSALSGQRSALPKIAGENIDSAAPPPWMVELANAMKLFGEIELPTGVIVGSAVIEKVEQIADFQLPIADSNRKSEIGNRKSMYEWHLTDVERATRLRKPEGHPQPVWFRPF